MSTEQPLATQVHEALSSDVKVLTDAASEEFQQRLTRWSKINIQTPAAIVLPRSETEAQKVVQWAVSCKIPFVCRSGGMSLYSTIGENGIIIDLSEWKNITVDRTKHQAVLAGGVVCKSVAVELAKAGYCTTLANVNPVGAIPCFLNGGNSAFIQKLGWGSDQIVSARIVTADGKLINVSDDENPDLLYALRGAGQSFGLVTQLTIRIYPLQQVLGNKEGTLWGGRFVFPLDRAEEVCEVMQSVIADREPCMSGLVAVMAPPPLFQPAIVVTASLVNRTRPPDEVFKRLFDLGPVASGGGDIPIQNAADALDAVCAPGDYKKIILTSINDLNPEVMAKIATQWKELATSCPDTKGSMFSFQWGSNPPKPSPFESANGLQHVQYWANNVIWCKDANSVEKAEKTLERVIQLSMAAQAPEDYVAFTDNPQSTPVEDSATGGIRLQKLKDLKQKWDPQGVFSRKFLD